MKESHQTTLGKTDAFQQGFRNGFKEGQAAGTLQRKWAEAKKVEAAEKLKEAKAVLEKEQSE